MTYSVININEHSFELFRQRPEPPGVYSTAQGNPLLYSMEKMATAAVTATILYMIKQRKAKDEELARKFAGGKLPAPPRRVSNSYP